MAKKKRVMKKAVKKSKSKSTKVFYHSTKEIKVERALITNFIGLQKVMAELSGKFDSLSSQISRLLNLFEVSARTLARKEASSGNIDAKRILEKLNNLTQQAGLIGKGLALIHEIGTENERPIIPLSPRPQTQIVFPQPTARAPVVSPSTSPIMNPSQPPQKMTRELGDYEKRKATRGWKLGEETNAGTGTNI